MLIHITPCFNIIVSDADGLKLKYRYQVSLTTAMLEQHKGRYQKVMKVNEISGRVDNGRTQADRNANIYQNLVSILV